MWKEEQSIHDEAQRRKEERERELRRMEEQARRLRQQQHARNVAGAMEQLIKKIMAEPNKEQELITFTRRRYAPDPQIPEHKESKLRELPSKLHIVTNSQFGGPTDALKLRPGLFRGRISLRWAPLVRNTPPKPPGGHF